MSVSRNRVITSWKTGVLPSLISQIGHILKFHFEKSKMKLEKGVLIISVDVDVGNKHLGIVNKGKNDVNVNRYLSEYAVGTIEELALPMFLGLFEEFEIPITFAIRGQWLEFPNDTLDCLLESSIKHDIGAHGYSHKRFKNLSREESNNEVAKTSIIMRSYGIFPRSFVFPGNSVAHLDVLVKHGFKCYRGGGDLLRDGMYVRHLDQLWDVHPSLFIDRYMMFPLIKRALDICSYRKLPFHLWFHLWNFGETQGLIQGFLKSLFYPLLRYAKREAREGRLDFATMASVTQKLN